jgi:MazG family protein
MADAPDADRPRVPAPPAEPVPTPGGAFARLVEIMRLLRSPEGCPWDRAQTPATLAPFVLEEAHEVVDAIERGDLGALAGEVGDLIFEGVFLAQLGADAGAFTAADALHHVNEKLIRRHPHVFAGAATSPDAPAPMVSTPAGVVEQWEEIKARERAGAQASWAGALDGIPRTLPALLTAHEIATRVSAVGFDWARAEDVVAKIEEEVAELRRALADETPARAAEELGDLLFAIASLARKLGLEPEAALRAANRKFAARFRALEEEVERRGQRVEALPLDDLEAIWQGVKRAS